MEGNSKNNQFSDSDREDNLDLTLRLGAPGNDTEDAEENKNTGSNTFHGFSGMDNYAANDKGNFTMHGNMQFGGSSSSYGGVEVGNVGAPYMALTTGMYAPNMAYGAGLLPQNPPTPTRKRKPDDSKFCRGCGVTSTPLWRKGPDGPQTLCNACGLRYLRVVKRDGE